MKALLSFALTPGLLFLFAVCGAQEARPPVIDMHMHAFFETWGEERYCFPEPCEAAPSLIAESDQLRPEALRQMREYNVVLAVVSSELEETLKWVEGDEDKFLPGLAIWHPDEIAIDAVADLIESKQIAVLGELGFQYENIAIDDPSVDPYLALAHKYDIPVHVHVSGLGGTDDFPVNLGNPLRIAKVLRKYPGLRVYFENAGWPFAEEMTSIMYQFPTVYADLSTILHLTPRDVAYRYIKTLVDNGLSKRLMYGSDQMVWPEVIGETVQAIENADFLSDEQKRDILYNNAARFLRLSDEQIAQHHRR